MPVPEPPRTRPLAFDYDEGSRSLVVDWADSTRQLIPFSQLRRHCPCAACSGELGVGGRFSVDPELHPGEDELADIALVGSYGLNCIWADGHNTGIYTFARLRELGEGS